MITTTQLTYEDASKAHRSAVAAASDAGRRYILANHQHQQAVAGGVAADRVAVLAERAAKAKEAWRQACRSADQANEVATAARTDEKGQSR